MGNNLCSGAEIQGDEESGWLFNALSFCDRQTRANCVFVAKRYYRILTTDASFRWRLERLHIEHGIISPSHLINDQSYKSFFLELEQKRDLWERDETIDESSKLSRCVQFEDGENYNISVFARVKPLDCDDHGAQDGQRAVLPLHQRLALIRIDKCLKSNKDALFVLKEQGGWFKEKWDEIERSSSNQKERIGENDSRLNHLNSGIKMIDTLNSRIVVMDSTIGLREFEFDGVMNDTVSQKDVYLITAHRLVCDVINGVSATCLVYGQTGSGKTFTMFGTQGNYNPVVGSNVSGIVPRACLELMSALAYRKKNLNLNIESNVFVSFVEVYGNNILDLLKSGKRVGNSKAVSQRSVLNGSAEVHVSDIDDVMRLLSIGEEHKRKAATAMNLRSSRAHSVFIFTLKQTNVSTGKTVLSKLFLADLGGCEQTKKSGLVAGKSKHIHSLKESQSSGAKNDFALPDDANTETKSSIGFVKSDRMREAVYINLGLMTLKACVEALTHGATHIPYSNSKLTMLLSEGLGGNNKTSVIVCAAQEDEHSSETINALKFGQACRHVSNRVRTQADMLGDLMRDLDQEIAACEDRIKMNEKWVVQEEKRRDGLAEEGTLESEGLGGFEVRKTTLFIGAEEDRKLLNKLLWKKSQLSGSSFTNKGTHMLIKESFGGIIGFGKAHEYELGQKFSSDTEKENYRFSERPDADLVPKAVKSTKHEAMCSRAAKTGRLAYSGISA